MGDGESNLNSVIANEKFPLRLQDSVLYVCLYTPNSEFWSGSDWALH